MFEGFRVSGFRGIGFGFYGAWECMACKVLGFRFRGLGLGV